MARWGVERTSRTPFPSRIPPVDASALMPPHIQGAERCTERRSGRTGSRWGLRALVIGGLAGAAWLLTGAAAHAADRDPAPEATLLGASLIGTVVDGDTAPPALDRVLKAAVQPLESDRPAHRSDVTSSVLTAPARVIARPAKVLTETLDEVTPSGTTDPTTALGAVDRVVRELSGPLRLTGGPADSRQLAPVVAPLTRTLRPVTGLLQQSTAAPVTAAAPASSSAVPASADTTRTTWATTTGTAATGTGPAPDVPAPGLTADERYSVGTTGSLGQRHPIVTDHRPTTATAFAPGTVRDRTPGGDGPVPLRVHLGAISGISTCGPGAPTEGGVTAFLPAAVAGSTMAVHRLRGATDVEVRRHDAEAPTVSPD